MASAGADFKKIDYLYSMVYSFSPIYLHYPLISLNFWFPTFTFAPILRSFNTSKNRNVCCIVSASAAWFIRLMGLSLWIKNLHPMFALILVSLFVCPIKNLPEMSFCNVQKIFWTSWDGSYKIVHWSYKPSPLQSSPRRLFAQGQLSRATPRSRLVVILCPGCSWPDPVWLQAITGREQSKFDGSQ